MPARMLRHTFPSAPAGLLLVCTLASCGLPVSSSSATSPTATPAATPTTHSSGSSVPTTQIDRLAEQTVTKVSPAVVKIENVGKGLGSGVIMSRDGYIVTNHHVVAGAHQIQVSLANGETLGAHLVGSDSADDLAVVKVKGGHLPAAVFGDSSQLVVGQTVLAIGNPLGITQTVTEGIVSALNRTVEEGSGGGVVRRAVQTSAPINPGNSGGALVNLGSEVVGIPTLAAVDPEFGTPANGIGFAIPSNLVTSISRQIIRYGKVLHSGRAALGVGVLTVTPDLAAQYHLPVAHGVLIARVAPHGPAARAGLKPGEIMVQVDATPITSEADLLDALANKNPGAKVSVTVIDQQGKQHTYRVQLGEFQVNSNG
jgi:S1-C subfamily serine protease